jgi:hypothetical protein
MAFNLPHPAASTFLTFSCSAVNPKIRVDLFSNDVRSHWEAKQCTAYSDKQAKTYAHSSAG